MNKKTVEQEIEQTLQFIKIIHQEYDFRRIPMEAEANLLKTVREGRFNDFKAPPYEKIKDNLGFLTKKETTAYAYVVLPFISSFTRVAIDEGVPSDDAFDLSDVLASRLSDCDTLDDIHTLFQVSGEMFAKLIYKQHISYQYHSLQTEKLLTFIRQNIYKKITLEDLAVYSGLSVGRISHLFMDELGISVHNYIQKEKITIACNLLMHTDQPIATIASYLGFQSPSNFAVVFRKWKHTSPTEYHQKMYREVY